MKKQITIQSIYHKKMYVHDTAWLTQCVWVYVRLLHPYSGGSVCVLCSIWTKHKSGCNLCFDDCKNESEMANWLDSHRFWKQLNSSNGLQQHRSSRIQSRCLRQQNALFKFLENFSRDSKPLECMKSTQNTLYISYIGCIA